MQNQTFKLSLKPNDYPPNVPFVYADQYDVGRTFVATVYDADGTLYNFTTETVTVVGTKPSGTGFSYTATASGNTVTFETTGQMTVVAGNVTCGIIIELDGDRIGTLHFVLHIQPAALSSDTIIDSDDFGSIITDAVEEWMDEHGVVIDDTLSVAGAAADAKTTGDELSDLRSAIALGGSFNAEVKSALETLLEHVAYIDANGQTYLDALHTAMYPPANLTRITAVYTQSGTVYDTDTLNSLKADLVVTAFYDNGTSEIVSTYTLSGTLTVGTSAITVSYGGKTTTFNVAVTEYVDTFTYGLVDNSSAITGSYITDTGEIETATQQSGYYEDYIDLYGISSVVIHYVKSAGTINYRISVYDANKVFTRQLHPTGNAYETVTLQSGERYIRLGWYLDSTSYTCKFYIQSTSPTALQMEIGDISGSTGEDTSSSVRVRSTGYIPASGSITIEDCPWEIWSNWTGVTGGGYFFRCYDSSKTIVGTLIGTNNQMYREDQKNLTLPTNTAYVRMELQKAGSTDISSGFTANTHPFAIDGVSYQVTEE